MDSKRCVSVRTLLDKLISSFFHHSSWAREPCIVHAGYWAGLHDNVTADLLPKWQKVRQSRATQPRCTDVPDWVTASAFWDRDSFNFKCHGRHLAPNRCNLGGGSGWSGTLSCNPALVSLRTPVKERSPFKNVFLRSTKHIIVGHHLWNEARSKTES